MSLVLERRFGGLTVRLDRALCVGFGDCVTEAPETFALDDEDLALFVDGSPDPGRERLLAACASCPVDALTLLDADGSQVHP